MIVADSIILDHFNLKILVGVIVSELGPYVFRFFKNLVFLRKIFWGHTVQYYHQINSILFSICKNIQKIVIRSSKFVL